MTVQAKLGGKHRHESVMNIAKTMKKNFFPTVNPVGFFLSIS